MHKKSHLINLRKKLLENDIHVQDWLFHSTDQEVGIHILKEGLRSRHGEIRSDNAAQNAICFSRSFSNSFKQDLVFIFDGRDLSARLKHSAFDYFQNSNEIAKDSFEYEERFYSETPVEGFCVKELVIPQKYIKAVVFKDAVNVSPLFMSLCQDKGIKVFNASGSNYVYTDARGGADISDIVSDIVSTSFDEISMSLDYYMNNGDTESFGVIIGLEDLTYTDNILILKDLIDLQDKSITDIEIGAAKEIKEMLYSDFDTHMSVTCTITEEGIDIYCEP